MQLQGQRYKILALLIIIQQVELIKAGYLGEIFEAPVDQIILPESNATFFCQGRGVVEWAINGTFLVTPSIINNFQQRGFVQKKVMVNPENTPNEFNITLTALGSMENNNTVIQCRAYGTDPGEVKRNAALIVAGPPQPPAPEIEVVNATTLRFYWEAPFSWEEFPPEAYMIALQNTSSGETLVDETSTALEYWYQQDDVAESCHQLIFTITASNAVGESDMGSVAGGFPIAPIITPDSDITTEVSFKQDLTPRVMIQFKPPPRICSFQVGECGIIIESENGSRVSTIGPLQFTAEQEDIVVNSYDLQRDTVYRVAFQWSTQAGNATGIYRHYFNTSFLSVTYSTEEKANKVLHIVIPSIGGTIVVCMVVAIFTAAGYYYKHKDRKGGLEALKQLKPGPMVANPIYEGAGDPFYDTIPVIEPSNKDPCLVSPTSTDSRYILRPCLSDSPPKQELEPEGKESEYIKFSLHREMGGAGGDCYTVMSSAGTFSHLTGTFPAISAPPPFDAPAPPPFTAAVVDDGQYITTTNA